MNSPIVSLLLQPAFYISVGVTAAAACYSYIYLPFQMRKAYRQSLLTLARAAETKDPLSEGHGERVAKLVVAVAREMHVPAKNKERMEYAAFLQDIGNVRVPHAILNKKGRLSEEEFETLSGHTQMGAEMAEQVAFLKEISPIIRHHHEAWDGTGYPDKLKGTHIPLGARILSVCTTYDSMIHVRNYRPGIDEETAVIEIRSAAGSKYDPEVVDAFLRVLKRRLKKDVSHHDI